MLAGAIASLQTGSYTVTRRGPGSYDANGRFVAGASATFAIVASVQAIGGRRLQDEPTGQRGGERMAVYTTSELRTRTPTSAPDTITIDGEIWTCTAVERWGSYYRAVVAREVATP